MASPKPPKLDATRRAVLGAVGAQVDDAGATWFPELSGSSLRTRLLAVSERPRCTLYRVCVDDGSSFRTVMVKARTAALSRRIDVSAAVRPRLAPQRTVTDADLAAGELTGLRLIGDAFADQVGERFGVIRVLAWLPEHLAIVMDEVRQPTLREVLLRGSRLSRGRLSSNLSSHLSGHRPDQDGERAVGNVGAWLRIYHSGVPDASLTDRLDRDHILGLYPRYADYIATQTGDRGGLRRLADAAAGRADELLPGTLPSATVHGDFTPRNVFTSDGQVTVFDPMPVWRVPIYEDLARFIVGMRLLGLQAISQGLAFDAGQLDAYEHALASGYFGADDTHLPALRAYTVLILLDKWAALVSAPIRGNAARQRLQRAQVGLLDRYYRRETARLVVLLSSR